ncbi:expressed protein [Phakopsora pachyrhizi]|uniref:Expressed protein n=1 Tax=Phakopsora pachyrhizi TaxID=170000 RepID=A0AAV0BQ74_PHAPC|nr:expressed protein [Phakopsora pachyrhizi]
MASVNVLFCYFLACKTLIVTHTNLSKDEIVLDGTTFWEWLRLAQASLEALTQIMPFVSSSNSCNVQKVGDLKTGLSRASVGFLGYIKYELHAESLLKNSLHSRSEVSVADAKLGFCIAALTYDHKTGVWAASTLVFIDESSSEALTEHLGLQVGMREAEYEAWEASLEEIFSATPTLKDVRQNDSNHKLLLPF